MDMQVKTRTITLKMIESWIATGESRSEIDVTITPEIAAALLKRNRAGDTNRALQRSYLDYVLRTMQQNQWVNTGEPIIISDEGILNDGQHRLTAIVQSGQNVVMDLRFGIQRLAFVNTNSGRSRQARDALNILKIDNSTNIAAMARLIHTYTIGLPNAAKTKVNNAIIADLVQKYPDMQEAHRLASRLRKPFRCAATNALAFFALRTENETVVAQFFDILASGEGSALHPGHQLREYITRIGFHRGGMDRLDVFAASITAWNAFRDAPAWGKIKFLPARQGAFPVCKDLRL